jgi:transposase
LAIVGCGPLTAAKIVGETAQVRRFRSKDAFARLNGTAPLPVWSSNKQRHRLSRTGNRQLNTALHRIAMTQARIHPPARELLQRRKLDGDGGMEALRVLKRRLCDVLYCALLTDQNQSLSASLDRGARDNGDGRIRSAFDTEWVTKVRAATAQDALGVAQAHVRSWQMPGAAR